MPERKRSPLKGKNASDQSENSKPVDSFAQEANQRDQANVMPEIVSLEQPDDNNDPQREPEVFRCLSCFSFFIPSGKWATFPDKQSLVWS